LGGIAYRSRQKLSHPGKRLSLALKTLTAACLLLALANPVVEVLDFPEQHLLFLIDRSDSITPSSDAQIETFIQRVNALRPSRARLGTVVFARNTETTQTPSADFSFVTPPRPAYTDATDIGGAIDYGLALLPMDGQASMVLFSDGNETVGNGRAAADRARQQGVAVHTVPITRKTEHIRGITKLSAPSRVRVGERFRLRALLANGGDTPVHARLILRKNGQVIDEESNVLVQPGTTPVSMEYRLDEIGLHGFELETAYEDGKISAVSPVFVDAADAPRLLIVAPVADAGGFFARVMAGRGFKIDERTTLPDQLEALLGYDGVVLNDVPCEILTDDRVERLKTYVQDFGGGLITIGGGAESSLDTFAGTSFETLLPVTLEKRHSIVKKRRDFLLLLLIDRSGSMMGEKMDMARAAAVNAVEGLEPGDAIGVIAFDDQAYPVVELTTLGNDKTDVIDSIRRLVPGGGTDPRTALVEAFRIFSTKQIGIRKHIILMTDGITSERQLLDITARLAEKKVTLSTIAIGTDANAAILDLMRKIGGGAFHVVIRFEELPRIVVKDMDERVKDADDIDERFVPELFDPAPMTAGIDSHDIPSLKGYVASTLKTAAIKPLMTNFRNREEPILAAWQYGLGCSMVMLAGVNSVWSDEWLRWRNFGRLWEQIARWTLRTRSTQDCFFSIHPTGGRIGVRVEIEGKTGTATGVRGTLRLSDGQHVSSVFTPLAEGAYEAIFPTRTPGMAHLTLIEEGVTGRVLWSGPHYLPSKTATAKGSS